MPSLNRRHFVHKLASLPAAWFLLGSSHAEETAGSEPKPSRPRGCAFTLWQLPSQTPSQMMSYVLRTGQGRVLVIDGGRAGDASYLKGFLGALGNEVHAWILTHPHGDHVEAVTALLGEPGKLKIHAIHGSLPEEDWVRRHEPQSARTLIALNRALAKAGRSVEPLRAGRLFKVGDFPIQILAVHNPEITPNAVNNSSVVMRLFGEKEVVLITGDLGVEGGRKLMASPQGQWLAADYVQMAHHGQNGVDKAFYRAVAPKSCLWPTPRWLWENDKGGGRGSGPWKTLEVREWMKQLDTKHHYVSADGLYRVEVL